MFPVCLFGVPREVEWIHARVGLAYHPCNSYVCLICRQGMSALPLNENEVIAYIGIRRFCTAGGVGPRFPPGN